MLIYGRPDRCDVRDIDTLIGADVAFAIATIVQQTVARTGECVWAQVQDRRDGRGRREDL